MTSRRAWAPRFSLVAISLFLGLLLVAQLRTRSDISRVASNDDWDYVVAELVVSNARLRTEIEALEEEVAGLRGSEGAAAILQSLVDEANQLRMANGLVEVSGPGVQVTVAGPVSVLDLQDLINELRNAGAEALALNDQRLIAWSAIASDGEQVTVDGQPVPAPYHLSAIGNPETLRAALLRPGGLVPLLREANASIVINVKESDRLTLPVYRQGVEFVYARPTD
ncbi:MAG TPA: DUF881 domain-containing protein [Anaerolineae bacterium]|nr:DUF881 domain-containing protein [Anaerolineae bacterium]